VKAVWVTPQMAERLLQFLQREGIAVFEDTITVEDLIRATQKEKKHGDDAAEDHIRG
jgi:hypothetical protein